MSTPITSHSCCRCPTFPADPGLRYRCIMRVVLGVLLLLGATLIGLRMASKVSPGVGKLGQVLVGVSLIGLAGSFFRSFRAERAENKFYETTSRESKIVYETHSPVHQEDFFPAPIAFAKGSELYFSRPSMGMSRLGKHEKEIISVWFLSNGNVLTVSQDWILKLWNPQNGAEVKSRWIELRKEDGAEVLSHRQCLQCADLCGRNFAIGVKDWVLQLDFEAKTLEYNPLSWLSSSFKIQGMGSISCLKYGRDIHDSFLFCGLEKGIMTWNLQNKSVHRAILWQCPSKVLSIECAQVTYVTGHLDGIVRTWDRQGQCLSTVQTPCGGGVRTLYVDFGAIKWMTGGHIDFRPFPFPAATEDPYAGGALHFTTPTGFSV